ncbi:MAG: hypothetical protein M1391_17510 [Bacteroidetes bacterium]|nr:hypothetical protein [Bacteroidota bacterium]
MKNLDEIKKILKKNKTYLRKKYSAEEIGIFGSFSRGNQNSRSDELPILEIVDSDNKMYPLRNKMTEI